MQYIHNLPSESLHEHGLIAVGPNGIGKTYFIEETQKSPEWIDGDNLMKYCGAMPSGGDWSSDSFEDILRACDVCLTKAKELGAWVISSTWWEPSIVNFFILPSEDRHKEYFLKKDDKFDSNFWEENTKPSRNAMRATAEAHHKPILGSVDELSDKLLIGNLNTNTGR